MDIVSCATHSFYLFGFWYDLGFYYHISEWEKRKDSFLLKLVAMAKVKNIRK